MFLIHLNYSLSLKKGKQNQNSDKLKIDLNFIWLINFQTKKNTIKIQIKDINWFENKDKRWLKMKPRSWQFLHIIKNRHLCSNAYSTHTGIIKYDDCKLKSNRVGSVFRKGDGWLKMI